MFPLNLTLEPVPTKNFETVMVGMLGLGKSWSSRHCGGPRLGRGEVRPVPASGALSQRVGGRLEVVSDRVSCNRQWLTGTKEMQIHSNDGQDQTGWLDNFLKGVDWPVGPSAAGGGQVNLGKVEGGGIQAHHSN